MKPNVYYFLLLLALFGCDKKDPEPTLEFTQDELIQMHGDSEKRWKVKQLFSEHSRSRLSALKPCHIDDTYTFKADSQEIEVSLGTQSCFWDDPEQELVEVMYSYDETDGSLFLDHARGEVKDSESVQVYYFLKLRELSDTHMLFASGRIGNFSRAILFEAVN